MIRRNFSKCSRRVKTQLYTSLVRPQLEYASSAWDPHRLGEIASFESVQKRAVRFVHNGYRRTSSVSTMMTAVGLPTLQNRRRNRRLTTFYDYTRGNLVINNLPRLQPPTRPGTRNAGRHNSVFANPYAPYTDYIRHSFLYTTIREWNSLPMSVVGSMSRTEFVSRLNTVQTP